MRVVSGPFFKRLEQPALGEIDRSTELYSRVGRGRAFVHPG